MFYISERRLWSLNVLEIYECTITVANHLVRCYHGDEEASWYKGKHCAHSKNGFRPLLENVVVRISVILASFWKMEQIGLSKNST